MFKRILQPQAVFHSIPLRAIIARRAQFIRRQVFNFQTGDLQ